MATIKKLTKLPLLLIKICVFTASENYGNIGLILSIISIVFI